MADSTAPASRRYPKRKRNEISYAYSDDDIKEEDISEDDDDLVAKPAKRIKRSTKPLPKKKIFPFMKLPAELRNKIYKECLTDEGGMYLLPKQSRFRRIVVRSLERDCDPKWHNRRYQAINNGSESYEDQSATKMKMLSPQLLAVSQQIYAESAQMLYAQEISFLNTYTMHSFLSGMSPRCAGLLKNLRILSWGDTRGHKSINFPSMALLATCGAVDLNRLSFDTSLGHFWSSSWRNGRTIPIPDRLANKVYRDCHPWLIAVGREKKDLFAGLEILKISDENFRGCSYRAPGAAQAEPITNEEVREGFVEHLKKLLRKNA